MFACPGPAIIQVTETLSSGSCPGGGTVCTSSYAFDDLDRLIQVTDRNGLNVSQRYDAADNRLARTGPEGETVYVYNGLDQITVVTPPDAAAIGLDPTAAGRWGEISHGNGVRTQVQYDGAGRMNAVRHWLGAAAVLLSTYSFDANGNRQTETIEAQSQSWLTSYDYDDADRLTGYTAPEGQTSYILDAVGNRTQTTSGGQLSTADFDARDRLTDIRDSGGQVVTHYDYDEAGRQTAQTSGGQTTHYSYSATDRLLAIRQGSPSAEPLVRYEYHRLSRGSANGGQRSARTDASSREHYQWDGLKLTVRTNALGNPLARYSHANGWTLASSEQGAEYSYQLDALGTPLILTDEAATIAVRYRLDPWGVVLEQTQAHVNPIEFTGYLRDTATDQLYAQARQYLPGVGRFGSVDPWEGDGLRPITLNSYLYGNGNPGVWVDPDGRAGFLTKLRDRFDASDDFLRQQAAQSGSAGLLGYSALRSVMIVGGTATRAVNLASDAVAQALPEEVFGSVVSQGAIELGETVDNTAFVVTHPLVTAEAGYHSARDTTSAVFAGDRAAASDTIGFFTEIGSGAAITRLRAGLQLARNAKVIHGSGFQEPSVPRVPEFLGADGEILDSGSGSIQYLELDHLGRPQGVFASITPDMIGTGSVANRSIIPPGWSGNGRAHNEARGHLLGNQLGGSGDFPENLVTIEQNSANSPVMRSVENQVRRAVEAGEVVQYSVRTLYHGDSPVPFGIEISAHGKDGFSVEATILNPLGGSQ